MSCVMCHVSCVMCHVSCVRCQVTDVTIFFFMGGDKEVEQVGGGSVINGAYPV